MLSVAARGQHFVQLAQLPLGQHQLVEAHVRGTAYGQIVEAGAELGLSGGQEVFHGQQRCVVGGHA